MTLCWKYMVPLTFLCLIGTAGWMVIWPEGNQAVSKIMFGIGTMIVLYFFWRVVYQIRHTHPTIYLKPYI